MAVNKMSLSQTLTAGHRREPQTGTQQWITELRSKWTALESIWEWQSLTGLLDFRVDYTPFEKAQKYKTNRLNAFIWCHLLYHKMAFTIHFCTDGSWNGLCIVCTHTKKPFHRRLSFRLLVQFLNTKHRTPFITPLRTLPYMFKVLLWFLLLFYETTHTQKAHGDKRGFGEIQR